MKKITVVIVLLLASLVLFSCKTAPAGPRLEGEVTQERVNEVLGQIYDRYRGNLDLTGAQQHVVVPGDTLSDITRRFYGTLTNVGEAGTNNGFFFPVIMMASDSHIVDPDLIEAGMTLTIPDLRRNLDNPGARRAIKDALIDVAYVYERKGRQATEAGLIRLSNSL